MEFDTLLRVASLAAQISIPFTIFFAGRVIARGQYMKSMQDAWNEFNKLAIENDHNIRIVREAFYPPPLAQESDDACRKVYLTYVLLNIFSGYFLGAKHGLLDKTYLNENFRDLLKHILEDDHVYEISQSRGYHPEFKKVCQAYREHRVTDTPIVT